MKLKNRGKKIHKKLKKISQCRKAFKIHHNPMKNNHRQLMKEATKEKNLNKEARLWQIRK